MKDLKNSERVIDKEMTKSFGRPIYETDPDCSNCHGKGTVFAHCDLWSCKGDHEILCVCREEGWDVEKQKWRPEVVN